MKDVFKQEEILSDFWAAISLQYIKIGIFTLRGLLLFSSTYLCEKRFYTLLNIKSKARNKLEVERYMRCALSKTLPNFSGLVSKKQIHKSH